MGDAPASFPARFLSCDWGTTSFRLRWVEGESVRREHRSDAGAKSIHTRCLEAGTASDPDTRAEAFARVLAEGIHQLQDPADPIPDDAPVLISGMASSSVGWKELPYGTTPCGVDGEGWRVERVIAHGTLEHDRPIWMVSGLTTGTDMMRGEETELLGILALPDLAHLREGCVVLLPGTHAKHVRVEGGRIVDFRTYMTGEMLELLSLQSLLRVSVTWPPPSQWNSPQADALRAGVQAARDLGLARGLFQVRVRTVLRKADAGTNTGFLWGLVLGAELSDLLNWSGSLPLVLAGSAQFSEPYRMVLECMKASDRLRMVPLVDLHLATVRAHRRLLTRLHPSSNHAQLR